MDNYKDDLMTSKARILTLILNESQSHKCIRLAKEKGIRGAMVMIGRGTVRSTILNLLGLKDPRREIVHFLLKKEQAQETLDYLDAELQLSKPGHGIAYITAVLDVVSLMNKDTDKKQINTCAAHSTEGESMFRKLTVIVERGMSDEVMDIARAAGVQGGTVVHGRAAGAESATKLFGVDIEPEKELVYILTPNNLVEKVVNALTEGLNLQEPGKGILFVEPILETRGLVEMNDQKQ